MLRHYYKERIKHAFRFRTRRGYGVHSPYMFNLIMCVLRDKKSNKYTYPPFNLSRSKDRKLIKLTYRLLSYLNPTIIYASGYRCELLKRCLPQYNIETSPQSILNASVVWIDNNNNRTQTEINAILEWAISNKEPHAILITNINKNENQRALWEKLKEVAKVNVEMMWCGLLIFNSKLQVGSYHMLP